MDRFELQALRDKPIETVAGRLGISVDRHKALCPFHDDHHASLSFRPGRNLCRCFVCMDRSLGPIDLVMRLRGVDFLEACRWLAEMDGGVWRGPRDGAAAGGRNYGGGTTAAVGGGQNCCGGTTAVVGGGRNCCGGTTAAVGGGRNYGGGTTAAVGGGRNYGGASESGGRNYGGGTTAAVGGGRSYGGGTTAAGGGGRNCCGGTTAAVGGGRNYGGGTTGAGAAGAFPREPTFDAARYERFFLRPQLGDEARRFLFTERRLDERVVRWCRLTSWTDRHGTPWLCIPYFDPSGRLIGVQNRNLAWRGPSDKAPRFRFPRGARCTVYGLQIVPRLRDGDDLYITEGCSDCWAMLSSGHKAIAVPSATLLSPADARMLTDLGSRLHLRWHMYPDRDVPGERLFLQLRDLLPTLEHHHLPPGCKDYSDAFLKSVERPSDG